MQNAEHKDWACTEEMMTLTKDGRALYLHCLPADISGVYVRRPQIAEEAKKLIRVTYEPLQPVRNVDEAKSPDAPLVH